MAGSVPPRRRWHRRRESEVLDATTGGALLRRPEDHRAPHQRARTDRASADRGGHVDGPDQRTTDFFGMDATHLVEASCKDLEPYAFTVSEETFYPGVFFRR